MSSLKLHPAQRPTDWASPVPYCDSCGAVRPAHEPDYALLSLSVELRGNARKGTRSTFTTAQADALSMYAHGYGYQAAGQLCGLSESAMRQRVTSAFDLLDRVGKLPAHLAVREAA